MQNEIRNVYESNSIPEAYWRRVAEQPDATLARYAVAGATTSEWRTCSYKESAVTVRKIAAYLSALGVTKGTPVSILSGTRLEWCLADLAIQSLGGVTVSIYQSLIPSEIGYLLFDSEATIVFAENQEQLQKLSSLHGKSVAIPEREDEPPREVPIRLQKVITFEATSEHELTASWSEIVGGKDTPNPEGYRSLTRDDTACIVYTSGTTGPPKGVVQSHGNHLSNVAQATESQVFPFDGSLFLYLPLAHSFARLTAYIGLLTPTYLVFPAVADTKTSKVDLTQVARNLRESASHVLPSVPRLYEKMAQGLMAKAEESSLQGRILNIALRNARVVYDAKTKKQRSPLSQRLLFALLAPIRKKIKRTLFGSRFSHGISGGARLDPEVNRFFDSVEIPICEGYGLTETCVATHVNRVNNRRIGSVGPALPQVEVLIQPDDGEIFLKGPNVTKQYFNRPAATREAWSADGWFKTGDIGHVDSDGFLFITDRKKDLIITAGGKKIPPQTIEGLVKNCPYISQALLFGDERPYCVMLVSINPAEIRQKFGIERTVTMEMLCSDERVRKLITGHIDSVNKGLASYESIKKFEVLVEDFTIENGLLTPTMKVKRKPAIARYRELIEGLYE